MSNVRQYIGARYVPIFMGEWDNTESYEPLSIVQYQGNSYTSRQHVPVGIDIDENDYWAMTGNYNAQIQSYIETVNAFDSRIDDLEDALPLSDFATDTVKDTIEETEDKLNQFKNEPISIGLGMKSTIYPKMNGIYRAKSYLYDTYSSPNNRVWGQGFCLKDSTYIQFLINNADTSDNTKIVERTIARSGSWHTADESNCLYHASSAIYLRDKNELLVAHGEWVSTAFVLNASDYSIKRTVDFSDTGANGIMVFAYDRKNDILYGSNTMHNLFTIDPETYEVIEYIEEFENGFSYLLDSENTSQDIAAYDGYIYVLTAISNSIRKYNLKNELVAIYDIPVHNNYTYFGEAEGIDIDINGQIYFTSVYHYKQTRAYYFNYVWTFDEYNNTKTNDFDLYDMKGSYCMINLEEATEANLMGCQQPKVVNNYITGIVTFEEALTLIGLNPQINVITAPGNHADEVVNTNLPNLCILGDPNDYCKLGSILFRGGTFFGGYIEFTPMYQAAWLYGGYRTSYTNLASCTKNMTYAPPGTPTNNNTSETKHDISIQGGGQYSSNWEVNTYDLS